MNGVVEINRNMYEQVVSLSEMVYDLMKSNKQDSWFEPITYDDLKRAKLVCGVISEGKLIGVALVYKTKGKNEYCIGSLCVSPRHYGEGIQISVMRYAIQRLSKTKRIICYVHHDNIYSSRNALLCGFKLTHIEGNDTPYECYIYENRN